MDRLGRTSRLAALALAGVLAGCAAGPTPYGPANGGGGYSDTAIEDNRFRVGFSGNSLTARETVETYLLYRAAEVTRANGFDWFRIVERETDTETRYYIDGRGPGPYYGWGYGSRSGVGVTFGWTSGVARPVRRFDASAVIQAFRGEKPEAEASAYDAAEVLRTLGPRIRRPGAEG